MATRSTEKVGLLGSSAGSNKLSSSPSLTPVTRKPLGTPGKRKKPPVFTVQQVATFCFQFIALVSALIFGAWAIKSYNAALAGNDLANQAFLATLAGNNLSQQSLQMTNTSNQGNSEQAALQLELSQSQMDLSQSQLQHVSAQAQVALIAAQLSLLQYCESSSEHSNTDLCSSIIAAAPLASIATALSIFSNNSTSPPPGSTAPFPTVTDAAPPSTTSNPTTTGFAISITTATSEPTTSPPAEDASSSPMTELGLGGIIGIILGVVGVIATILVIVLYRMRRRQIAAEVE